MNEEVKRLETFTKWPINAPVTAESCAKVGFFYTGKKMEVECYFCRVRIKDWHQGDNPLDKHIYMSPECPFMIDPFLSGNVPIFRKRSTVPPDYLTYKSRLKSFQNWAYGDIVSPKSLAEAGFYSLQQNDKVKCVYCQGVVLHWESGDDPKAEHKKLFPKCKFVLSNFDPDSPELKSKKDKMIASYSQQHLVTRSGGPSNPNYKNETDRLNTFVNWPANKIQTPEAMAQAGFYYSGTRDKVKCFYCNGTLESWQPEDDVWEQHAKWFPDCQFLRKKKGLAYIRRYTNVHVQLDTDVTYIGSSKTK